MSKLIPADPRSNISIYLFVEMDNEDIIWKTENGVRSRLICEDREYKALKKVLDNFGTENLSHRIKQRGVDDYDF